MTQWPGPLGLGPDDKRSSQHPIVSFAISYTDGYASRWFSPAKSSDNTLVAPTWVWHSRTTKMTKVIKRMLSRRKYMADAAPKKTKEKSSFGKGVEGRGLFGECFLLNVG